MTTQTVLTTRIEVGDKLAGGTVAKVTTWGDQPEHRNPAQRKAGGLVLINFDDGETVGFGFDDLIRYGHITA